jgi:uncharacterized protein (TIGR00299 family) protein
MKTSIGKGLHLHFDPCSGVAGDMAVAALVDAGVPEKVVSGAIGAMGVQGLKVGFERRKRGAFVGMGFTVDWPGKGKKHGHDHDHDHGHDHDQGHGHDQGHDAGSGKAHEHRDYAEIRRLLRKAAFEPKAKKLAGDIFERIARAEGALHGVSVDKVAFHEVGAWDSIADIVGAAAALAWLEPVDVTSTPPVVGSGTIRTAHGLMPVPAPATAAILRGLPVLTDGKGELTTPTGAAILATVVRSFGPPPPLRLMAQGFGAGTREFADRPNVLRVMLGEVVGQALPASASEVVLVASNIDDMSPQLAEPLMTALFAAGAVDVWFTPILMKKGRPAVEVSALCPPGALAVVEQAFFANSTTIGLRHQIMNRTVLDRALAKVTTIYGDVRVKVAAREGEILGATPEFEDCRKLALRAKVPVRTVMADAVAAACALLHPSKEKPKK